MLCVRRLNLRLQSTTLPQQLARLSPGAHSCFYATRSSTKSDKTQTSPKKKKVSASEASKESKEVENPEKTPKNASTQRASTKSKTPKEPKEGTVRKRKKKEKNENMESKLPKENSQTARVLPLDGITQSQQKSNVRVGTEFEMRSLKLLRENLSMDLSRVAGPGDGGVDLIGWWWLPKLPYPPLGHSGDSGDASQVTRIRVLAQCKAEKSKAGPHYVRDMEGVLHRLLYTHKAPLTDVKNVPPSQLEEGLVNSPLPVPTIAMLISRSSFTKGAVTRAMSSPVPFILFHLPPQDEPEGTTDDQRPVPSLQWNHALASERGILQGKLEFRWTHTKEGGYPVIWWAGRPLPNNVPSS